MNATDGECGTGLNPVPQRLKPSVYRVALGDLASVQGMWHGFETRGRRLETDATQGLEKGDAEADPRVS